jgi:uncharacterized protein
MKLIFAVNHPAQYHLFKNPYLGLKSRGHDVVFVIKGKDILEPLMISDQVDFVTLAKRSHRKSRFSILAKGLWEVIIQGKNLWDFARKYKPDLMIGTDYSISHVGKVLKIPSIVFNEDDYQVNKFFCLLAYPCCTFIVSPQVCSVGKYYKKKIEYNGYQKLAYLHPKVFKPDLAIVKKYIPGDSKYYLIRLVHFSAGHDIEMKHGGIGFKEINTLIKSLKSRGKVFITSESQIPNHLKKYQLNIDYKDIHHILYYCDLFIADSQSMIVEAAMLGTPSIRFNSFVGKISVLEELEHKYKLTIGIHNSKPELLIQTVKECLKTQNLRNEFQKRRTLMLSEKLEVSSFFIWLIENYPKSVSNMLNGQGWQ